jgi:hypothetical protein
MNFNPPYGSFNLHDEFVVRHKGDQLKFKIYDGGESSVAYLNVEEVRRLRDYLTSVLPEPVSEPQIIGPDAGRSPKP